MTERIPFLISPTSYFVSLNSKLHDNSYIDLLGIYENYDDAILAMSAKIELLDNDGKDVKKDDKNIYFSIYKIDMNENKIRDFYKKDLTDSSIQSLLEVRNKNEHSSIKVNQEGKPEQILKNKKDDDFPKPDKSAQKSAGVNEITPPQPIFPRVRPVKK